MSVLLESFWFCFKKWNTRRQADDKVFVLHIKHFYFQVILASPQPGSSPIPGKARLGEHWLESETDVEIWSNLFLQEKNLKPTKVKWFGQNDMVSDKQD